MSAWTLAGVALLGGLGALARYALDAAVSRRLGRGFPYGTLAVNVSGSAALGLLAGVALDDRALALAGVGLLGAFTTFSTWAYESHRLAVQGRGGLGALNLGLSLTLGLAAVWLGRAVAAAL